MAAHTSSSLRSVRALIALLAAPFVGLLAFLVVRFHVSLFGLKGIPLHCLSGAFLAVATINALIVFWQHVRWSRIREKVMAILFALSSAIPLIAGFSMVARGPQGAGTAAAGIGFLIGVVVFGTGVVALCLAIWFAVASDETA